MTGSEEHDTGAPHECELCGQPIYTELNLAPIENGDGETVQACPGCHGAAGGG